MTTSSLRLLAVCLLLVFSGLQPLWAVHEGKLHILLVGDSTTEAKIPKMLRPQGPHFEDVIRLQLAGEKDLPPVNVLNLGLSGEFIRRLLDSGRYDKDIAKVPGADYIFIRYGINDQAKRENFPENFVKDYHELIARLKQDHPGAMLIIMTVIPWSDENRTTQINDLNRKVAEIEGLPLFDIYPRYAEEMKKGPNMLNYRRYAADKIPDKFRELTKSLIQGNSVIVMDNQFDAQLGDLPGWYGDRHPNQAGYQVIADETVKYLTRVIRAKNPTVSAAVAPSELFKATPLTEARLFTDGIEGPACDHAGKVYVVNIGEQGTVGRITPAGKAELFVKLPEGSIGNGIRFSRDGESFFVADYTKHQVLKVDLATKAISVHAREDGMNQPNDLAITAEGDLYASDPAWKDGTGQLWRVDRAGKVSRIAHGMGTTNGIDVSPDGKTLYVNESVQRNVWAFPIHADGNLGEKRLLKPFPDFGFDGMRCDVAGNLYITRHGKGTVVKLNPAGEVLQEIDVLGKSPTNLCFGGPDGKTVYVTDADQCRIVQFRVDVPGLEWERQKLSGKN
ncbi:MAG TPA: SMP-30/gluconolactonase/LRE family protein [Verrucomicrobium sp.]|nr:SMP-30/gluconolactonase/LRE family protein [Verrucomicrobium sp.]